MISRLPLFSYALHGVRTICPICGSDVAEKLSNWDRRLKPLPQVKCVECAVIRHEFMPTSTELDQYYKKHYRSDYQSARKGPSLRHLEKRRSEAVRRLHRLQPHLSAGGQLIDFGCGSGEFVAESIAAGYLARGFEPGQNYAAYALNERSLPVENCGWRDYIVLGSGVAAVTSFHVFEHLADPLSAFQRAASWLAPGGVLYVEVPNMANSLKKGFGCLHMAHVVGFGRFNLELMGALAGMSVVETFNDYDIGLIFQKGVPRDFEEIKHDARTELSIWTQTTVNRQFWLYTLSKLSGRRTIMRAW